MSRKHHASPPDVAAGGTDRKFVSLKVIAEQWMVDRSTVRRILNQAGIQPVILGNGRNGSVRYVESEIDDWLKTRERAS